MAKAAERRNIAKFEELNGMECIECGTCSYICPAKRPLTQFFKQMRREVMTARRAKQAAEAAKKAEAEKKA
jgi:electron transport complex protein RnfC